MRRLGALLLALGLLIQIASRVYQVWVPISQRAAPIETDDAYTYIGKAVQLDECFRQDCTALNDLRLQLSAASPDPGIAWVRYREYGRAFLVYHPLHSLIVWAGHQLGLSWEAAYETVEVCGGVFIGFSLALWLWALWGPGPAGIGMILSAFVLFPNQGLNHIVPGNLALGLAATTWATMLFRRSWAYFVVPFGVLAMVLMHPTGRIFALVTVAVFALTEDRLLSKRTLSIVSLATVILGMAFLLPHVVSRPEMIVKSDPPREFWVDWWGYILNGSRAFGIVKDWAALYGGPLVVVPLLAAGFVTSPPLRRPRLLLFAGSLAGLAAASLFYVLPRYPANLFSRLWVPVALLLTGAIGQAIWRWLIALLETPAMLRRSSSPSRLRLRLVAPAALVIVGMALTWIVAGAVATGARSIREKVQHRTSREPILLDPAQPIELLARSAPADAVVYMAEVPMHFHLAHGALARGAVFAPALVGTPEQRQWLDDNRAIRFVAAWSPIQRLSIAREGALHLEAGDRLAISASPPRPASALRFLVENRGTATTIVLRSNPGGRDAPDRTIEIDVPARSTGWIGAGTEGEAAGASFLLETKRTGPDLRLKGLRADQADASSLFWPWSAGIRLSYRDRHDVSPVTIGFDPAELCPQLKRPVQVLSDGGSTVLGRFAD